MRIVLVCRAYVTHRPSGMAFVCQDRAEQLARDGHDVHVLTTHKPGAPSLERHNGVVVHYLLSKPLEYSPQFAAGCEAKCRELEPDVIHLDGVDWRSPWWKSRPGTPRVVSCTMHGVRFGDFLTRWNLYRTGFDSTVPVLPAADFRAEAESLASFDHVFAVSVHEQTLLEDCYGLTNVKLVYNPIAREFFTASEMSPPPRDRRFLCAALTGHPVRGFRLAEKAAEDAGVKIVVAQDCLRTKMPLLIDSATAVVLPTHFAMGYDLIVAEAFARRRPVIVGATGSYLREERLHGNDWPGLVVQLGNQDALSKAMTGPLPIDDGHMVAMERLADRHRPEKHAECWLSSLGLDWMKVR